MIKLENDCKAYPIETFRDYSGFPATATVERSSDAMPDPQEAPDHSYAFLQEDYTVTSDIFMDESVIFSDVTPAWASSGSRSSW